MTTKSEQLSALIEEMDGIEKLAKSIQEMLDGPDDAEKIRKLQSLYLDWYARCRSIIDSDISRRELCKYYKGDTYSIHDYIGNPTRLYKNSSGYHQFFHSFNGYFRKPFNEQRLLLMRLRAHSSVAESSPPAPEPPPPFDTIRLHSRVRAVSRELFKNGHYRQAVFQSCLALNEAVQERSGRSDLDGKSLMEHVFSPSKPILQFSGHKDEQQGFMWIFSGVSMAIRNPRAHKTGDGEDLDANEALELLAIISALFRALDTAKKIEAEA